MSRPLENIPLSPISPMNSPRPNLYTSPESYAEPFYPVTGGVHPDPPIEIGETKPILPPRPNQMLHNETSDTIFSTTSTLLPSQSTAPFTEDSILKCSDPEAQSFLNNSLNKPDTSEASNQVGIQYKDNSRRQLWHILLGSSFRWLITLALCWAYFILVVMYWDTGARTEKQKMLFNALSTGLSIALGLNIVSAFKEMAVNMRWFFLKKGARTLAEVDLLLSAESLTKLFYLAVKFPRPRVILCCTVWLLINFAAQVGIASLSLTYSFITDPANILWTENSDFIIPDVSHFYSQANATDKDPKSPDEKYIAHLYGQLGYYYGVNTTDNVPAAMPAAGTIFNSSSDMIWEDDTHNYTAFQFQISPSGSNNIDPYSAYSDRTIEVSHVCLSWQVEDLSNINETTYRSIEVPDVGNVTMPVTTNVTTFFTDANNTCGPRCGIVKAIEVTEFGSWYYACNITMSETKHDPNNYSTISDEMAQIAINSIAETVVADVGRPSYQIYPLESSFGFPLEGYEVGQGAGISIHAIGAIVGAALYNPVRSVTGRSPGGGQILVVGHKGEFSCVLFLLAIVHLIFAIISAILSNRVVVGPDEHLEMSMLLKPVAETLHGVSGGEKNKAYKLAKKETQVRYEKGPNGRWGLNMLV